MKKNDDLVSIIIPVYNVETYISECIESVVSQIYDNIEIILVDDGSTDTSSTICDEYAKKDSRIRVVHKNNGGVSDARNVGIELSKGEWIAFIDADDIISVHYIEYLLKVCKQYDSDMSYCGMKDFADRAELLSVRNSNYENIEKENYDKLFVLQNCFPLWLQGNVCGKLIKKKLFNKIRFTKGLIRAEDLEVVYLLVNEAQKISTIRHCVLYYYRKRPNSAMTIVNIKALQDFEVRMKVYNFFKTIPGCEKTRESFAAQTMRIFLNFALLKKNHVLDYRCFRTELQKYAKKLVKVMWTNHAETISEKSEVILLNHSISIWVIFRLFQYKIIKKPLYLS